MKYGMLLPHFGEQCRPERLIETSTKLEEWGFDSVWVRDHLLWKPHGMEGTNTTFVEPFIVLAAVAGATKRIELGTAVVIPIRWPLKVAQDFASLSYIGQRRVHAGYGLGSNRKELAAAGFDVDERAAIYEETVEICKLAWSQEEFSYHGKKFQYENVSISPRPPVTPLTWYGGTSRRSVRRAAEECEGWLPGRLPMATLDDRLSYLHTLEGRLNRTVKAGVIPLVAIDEDRSRARAGIDVDALAHSSEGSKDWIKPPSGNFETIEDLEGLLLAGDPDDIVNELLKFEERNIDTFVFDLRLQFDRYEEKAELIGREVLPRVRARTQHAVGSK